MTSEVHVSRSQLAPERRKQIKTMQGIEPTGFDALLCEPSLDNR